YKRIAAASDEETLQREALAAADRYGASPPAFSRLLDLARLRFPVTVVEDHLPFPYVGTNTRDAAQR
ncbi:MAG TPA: TRCF domain-containing protein, partial [Thermoanaerobaculia bacterium]|nr:TRCF domain-containing protein [Thermoanaerobaculia bacterium]